MKRPTIIVVLEKILCKLITITIDYFSFSFYKNDKMWYLTFATKEEIVDQGEDKSDAFYGIL